MPKTIRRTLLSSSPRTCQSHPNWTIPHSGGVGAVADPVAQHGWPMVLVVVEPLALARHHMSVCARLGLTLAGGSRGIRRVPLT